LAGKNSAALGYTLESRCITIELKRKTRTEHVERFRREADGPATPLFESLRSLASHYVDELALARPDLPEELRDREQDVWEPLLAIADLAGADWSERARTAAVTLTTGTEPEESLGVRLLADCRDVLDGLERVATARLIELLALLDEAPWAEKWWDSFKGEPRPVAPRNLAWHLRRYGIHSETLRLDDGQRLKGYRRDRFHDAWTRYLPPLDPPTRDIRDNPHEHGDRVPSTTRDTSPSVTDVEQASNPHEHSDVTDATDKKRLPESERERAVLRDQVRRKQLELAEASSRDSDRLFRDEVTEEEIARLEAIGGEMGS